jgi:hypothetical protein
MNSKIFRRAAMRIFEGPVHACRGREQQQQLFSKAIEMRGERSESKPYYSIGP